MSETENGFTLGSMVGQRHPDPAREYWGEGKPNQLEVSAGADNPLPAQGAGPFPPLGGH